ncbi:MAG: helix-turn-helix domain-containing protein [Candidatus Tokpelaia sp.]|uniref:helix-turn-helix domain-containing protein n=1 Tax=Candidatus Tokpelaia sp. TaxID=2233777 RepID=UPI00123AF843|nr:helix-turn-helix domain-containing protein [Candidatus Tokpelaia sp.]KAA6204566.1 MAG: helix-turn-helix domain-containing protein [Candidatus Tokpelaia sp.]KAA6206847.1 MAG: helix-turn-helix domain-containing protein [Candidatus Tokpelaia sp.]KAA6404608.1 transcriptional regulator [Candidatus Tokpelaia sp.]
MTQQDKIYHYTEIGLDNVYLIGIAPEIDDAGEEIITIPFINKLFKAVAEAIVGYKKGISGAELRYLRTEMGLTQAELAALLHKDKQTIGRWERGETEIDGTAEAVIRRLAIEKLSLNVNLGMEELAKRSVATADRQKICLIYANDNRDRPYQLQEAA